MAGNKKLGEMKTAWLMQWVGIEEKIVGVFSIRKSFDKILEIAKEIYVHERTPFSKKVYLSHYMMGEKRKREFFGKQVPVSTHYQSDIYRYLIEFSKKNGLDHPKTKELCQKWVNYPNYVMVGHNSILKISRVFNLTVYLNNNGKEMVEWDEQLVNGDFKSKKFEFKNQQH